MIKILPLPAAGPVNQGGQYTYCVNLIDLFKDSSNIEFDKISQPKCKKLPIFNKLWFNWKDLYKRIKDSNCDIVFINGYAEFSVWQEFVVAKLLKKKIVYAPHFHPFDFLERPFAGKVFFNIALRPLLSWTSSVVTIGKTDYAYFNKMKNVKRVYMIPHHFIATPIAKDKPEKKDNMILFVGRNEPNKGMEYLYQLPAKYETHCVTGGELKRADFIQHKNIPQDELSVLYNEASLVVIPSRYEAFSYVALEAFTHGTPVVMSSNVKIADHLENEKGFSIFPYGDIKSFITKVEETIGKPVDTERILSKFDPKKIRRQYETVFIEATK